MEKNMTKTQNDTALTLVAGATRSTMGRYSSRPPVSAGHFVVSELTPHAAAALRKGKVQGVVRELQRVRRAAMRVQIRFQLMTLQNDLTLLAYAAMAAVDDGPIDGSLGVLARAAHDHLTLMAGELAHLDVERWSLLRDDVVEDLAALGRYFRPFISAYRALPDRCEFHARSDDALPRELRHFLTQV